MSLKGIAAVWAEQGQASAGLEGTDHLTDRGAVILDVLDHFVAEDQVKGRGGKRQEFARSVDDVWRVDMRFDGAFEVVLQTGDLASKRGEVLDVHSHPAAVFQYPALDPFSGGMDDHLQPPLLSRPPDVGWLTAQGCFVEVSLMHVSIISCKF